ncbi:MAG: hypothetical protein MnENMB40S_25240 [Rhizobiaceae bacterium MnEN-MB40S]|nr:MAG: hypothetical protein MnENMB40S_25240 [Rhizobiaceae bacterium MnEN-MB40S]
MEFSPVTVTVPSPFVDVPMWADPVLTVPPSCTFRYPVPFSPMRIELTIFHVEFSPVTVAVPAAVSVEPI